MLNSNASRSAGREANRPDWDAPQRELLANLRWVVDQTQAEIVVSSTWRIKEQQHEQLKAALREHGLETVGAGEDLTTDIPEDWLRLLTEKFLSDEEKAQIEALGGFDKLMETLKKRLEEQKGHHQGGSKWVGTAGTSPFGAYAQLV